MKVENKKFKVNFSKWKTKLDEKGRRMKLYVKLDKQETHKWNLIREAIVGNGADVDTDQFTKIIFFRGLNAFMDDINKAVEDMSDEEREGVLTEAGVESETSVVVPIMKDEDENDRESDEQVGESTELSSEE